MSQGRHLRRELQAIKRRIAGAELDAQRADIRRRAKRTLWIVFVLGVIVGAVAFALLFHWL